MGQKVHPRGFRVGITQKHHSTWFANPSLYKQRVEVEDFLQKEIFSAFKITKFSRNEDSNIARVEVDYQILLVHDKKKIIKQIENGISIWIHTPNTRAFAGKSQEVLKNLASSFQKKLKTRVEIQLKEIPKHRAISAKLIAEFIGTNLEKRINYRVAMKKALKEAQRTYVQGIKIKLSGRLNGAEIARSEWIRDGRVPLHTLRADIDYYHHPAQTIHGILGIKVWVFYVNVY